MKDETFSFCCPHCNEYVDFRVKDLTYDEDISTCPKCNKEVIICYEGEDCVDDYSDCWDVWNIKE